MLFVRFIVAFSLIASVFAEITNLSELEFDENDRLAKHMLLYHGNEACKNSVENLELSLRFSEGMDQSVARGFFGDVSSDCSAVCLERGTHIDHILNPLPMHKHNSLTGLVEFVRNKCQKTEVGFLSYTPRESIIYWVSPDGARHQIGILKLGERNTSWQQSYLGHVFEIVDIETGEVWRRITVEHHAIYPIGSPSSSVRPRDVRAQVKNTFRAEWERSHRVKRTFTETGFNRGRLPDDLWASISSYYYNNRNNKVLEEWWDTKGVFVNWWERDVYFIPMPWELKVRSTAPLAPSLCLC